MEGGGEHELESIIAERPCDGRGRSEYLCHWAGYGHEADTWERMDGQPEHFLELVDAFLERRCAPMPEKLRAPPLRAGALAEVLLARALAMHARASK